MKKITVIITSLALIALLFTQSTSGSEKLPDAPNAPAGFTATTLYDGFKHPWGMAWLPDGRMLVTERSGEILVFKDDKFTGEKLSGVPTVFNEGQGGLMDIQLHPDYKENHWIYISYAKPVEGGATTAVARFKLNGNQVVEMKDLFLAKQFLPADYHF